MTRTAMRPGAPTGASELARPSRRSEPDAPATGVRSLPRYAMGAAFLIVAVAVAWSLGALILVAAAALGVAGGYGWARAGRSGSGLAGDRHVASRVRDVLRAIETGEFEMLYQPQVRLGSGRPYGAEALLRWRRGGELLTPAAFLSEIEDSEAMGPLTEHVLELVVEQAARWRESGRRGRLSVNLSPTNLCDPAIPDTIEQLLRRYELPADMLTIELTETAVVRHPEETRAILDRISALGVRVSIDDFGTGYSSMLWLRLFPVDELKIDRTFVATMLEESDAYVAGAIRLAHDLDLSVVAEGIEDTATLRHLQRLGCENGQGYLFAKPMSAEEMGAWLDAGGDAEWARQPARVTVVNSSSSLMEARDLVEHVATDLGFTRDAIWDMKVAVSEALSVALRSAASGAEDGAVRLELVPDGDQLHMHVTNGCKSSRQSLGSLNRGDRLAVITGLVDEIALSRTADDTTEIRLDKSQDRAGAAKAG